MRKALVVIVIVLAIIGIALWRHRGSAERTAPRATHTTTTPAPTTYRSADGVEHTIPAWMFASGAPARHIAGRVLFHGEPVKDAAVALQSGLTANDLVAPIEKRTDARGQFDFGALPAAAYDVTAVAPNTTAAIEHVELSDPGRKPASDQLELVLGDCATSIEGTVYDATNNPLPKVRVRRDGLVGPETDARGPYKTCVPFGDVELHYSADGYGSVILTIDARGQMKRDVILVPEAALSVRAVRTDNGEP